MHILNLLVSDHTFRTVALGCSLLGMVSGILGCFAVLRKQSLLGDAVSHASLPGVCLAFLFTNVKNTEVLLLGALITGIVCIGLIQLIQNYTKIKFDSALALILSVFFGLGLVLLSYLNKENIAGVIHFRTVNDVQEKKTFEDFDTKYTVVFTISPFESISVNAQLIKLVLSKKDSFTSIE